MTERHEAIEVHIFCCDTRQDRWWWRTDDECGGPFTSKDAAMKDFEVKKFGPRAKIKDPKDMTLDEKHAELRRLLGVIDSADSFLAVHRAELKLN
jgi:hypothetical protein